MKYSALTEKIRTKVGEIINEVLHDSDIWEEEVGEWLKVMLAERRAFLEFDGDGAHFFISIGDQVIETGCDVEIHGSDYDIEDCELELRGLNLFIELLQEEKKKLEQELAALSSQTNAA